MCNYNIESKRAVACLPVPVSDVHQAIGPKAHQALVKAVRSGRARRHRDLKSGRRLPSRELAQGHYMTPQNFESSLARMNAQPHLCAWCGTRLPTRSTAQHMHPHNHREQINHHFHPKCWQARLLAIAIIFGHLQPQDIVPHSQRSHRRTASNGKATVTETVTVKIQRTINLPQRAKSQDAETLSHQRAVRRRRS